MQFFKKIYPLYILLILVLVFINFACKKEKKIVYKFDTSVLFTDGPYYGRASGEWFIEKFEIAGGDSTRQHFTVNYREALPQTILFLIGDDEMSNKRKKGERKQDSKDEIKFGASYTYNLCSIGGTFHFNDEHSQFIFHDTPGECPSLTKYKKGELHQIFVLVDHGHTIWSIEYLNAESMMIKTIYKEKIYKVYIKKITQIYTPNQTKPDEI